MRNRFRSIEGWSKIFGHLHRGPPLKFDFNPNVAPTELVPIFIADPDSPKAIIARCGINLTDKDGNRARRCSMPEPAECAGAVPQTAPRAPLRPGVRLLRMAPFELDQFAVRPMDRTMNNARQKNLNFIDSAVDNMHS